MGFINYLINGISLGSVYAIIALGYTMVYGIAKMLNFAHGDVIMIGSYVVFVTVSTMGFPPLRFTSCRTDYGHRCQLSAAECGPAYIRCGYEVIYIRCHHPCH